ncbi:head-to-tail adaptor [Gordonia phage DatBoi]|nr:head-to-tail adaptor [Gordonia phage DatBoi]
MALFATAQDVFDGSYLPLDRSRESWINTQIENAEGLLRTEVRRLRNVQSLSDLSALDASNAKAVIVNAVLRMAHNPKGLKREGVQDQSFERFAEARGGEIYFTDKELSRFRTNARRRIGNISVAPPKWGQV